MPHRPTARLTALIAALLVSLTACEWGFVTGTETDRIVGSDPQSVTLSLGEELIVQLRTVGPGEYASPPGISTRSVQFLGVEYAGVQVPAGPTQEFHFRGVARGTAVLHFTHTYSDREVEHTVTVR